MKKGKKLFVVLMLTVALAVSGVIMSVQADAQMTASISTQPSGAGLADKSDFNIVWQNSGNTRNFTGLHRNTPGNFDDFILKILVNKSGEGYKSFNQFGGASMNIQSGNMHVHGLSLTAGDLIKFDTGFRFITGPADNWGGDTPESMLEYSSAPALDAPIIFEREASGSFLTVGANPIGINIPSDEITLIVGDSQNIGAKTRPINATNNALTYESDKTNIATVDADGLVTGVSAGTAVITVTTENSLTAEVTVVVTAGAVAAESITLTTASATLAVAGEVKINATVNPADTTDKTLTYESSDSAIAEVDANGNVLAKKAGTAVITVKAHNDVSEDFNVTVSAERTDVKVTAYTSSFGNGNSKAFTFDFGSTRAGNDINNLRGRADADGLKINDYILINDKPLNETTGADFQFWSGELYANGITPVEGMTIELRDGLHFPIVCKGSAYNGRIIFRDYLGETFKVRYLSGAWAKVALSGSENTIVSINRVSEMKGGVIDVDRLSFGVNFEIPVVDVLLEDLQDTAAYNTNFLINDKTVAQINAEFTATHPDEGDVPVVKMSANGTMVTLSIAKSVKKSGVNAIIITDSDSFKFELKKEFVSTTGMIHTVDIVRYYIPEFEFWSKVEPFERTKTSDVYVTGVAYSVIDGGINGCLDITFNANIAPGTILGYGIHPMYLISSAVSDIYGAKAIANELASSGAAHHIFNNLLINGKSIKQYWIDEEIGSYEAMSDRFQIHITSARVISIRTNVSSTFGPNNDFTVTLKKGLMFYSGATLNEDMIVTYTGTGAKTATFVYGITLNLTATETTVVEGGTVNLSSGLDTGCILPVEYSSSNETVATVSNEGVVTAVAAGTAIITLVCGDKTDTLEITVTAQIVPVESVTVTNATVSIVAGGTSQISATVNPSNATNKTVEYSSSNTAVATVSGSGLITAVAAGTATITVSCGGKSTTVTVTVTAATVAVESVTVTNATVSIAVGGTSQISATVNPSNATNKTVDYSSSNTAVATVSSSGLITAVAAGTATITVSCGGKSTTVTVTVTAASEDKPGCGSIIGAGSALFSVVALAGSLFISKKRKSF